MAGLYSAFTKKEVSNLTLYIAGIMCYKFVLEFFNGSMSNIVLARVAASTLPKGFAVSDLWTIMQSVNLLCQCIGSILVAPLARKFGTPTVLSFAILGFAIVVSLVCILEAATGGTLPPADAKSLKVTANNVTTVTLVAMQPKYWGSWSPYLLFVIFPVAGIFHGMVELIRRVIPADIVGGNPEKLLKMDATVHIWYEVAGTSGAFVAAYSLARFGYAYSTMWIPVSFSLAFLLWRLIDIKKEPEADEKQAGVTSEAQVILSTSDEEAGPKRGLCGEIAFFFNAFFHSVKVGATLVFTNTSLIWLIPAYVLPLVVHRYFENTFFPFYSKFNLGDGAVQQILIGGSNLGELLGAVAVLFTATIIRTPLPWLRADAVTLLLIFFWCAYVIPDQVTKFDSKTQITYLTFPAGAAINAVGWAWRMAPMSMLVSFGWASGDVSLSAYVQERLQPLEKKDKSVSLLGSVMSFLYVSYLVIFFVLNIGISKCLGNLNFTATYGKKAAPYDVVLPTMQFNWYMIGGVFFTLSAIIIFASTFIPQGSCAINPDMPSDEIKVADGLLDTKEKMTAADKEAMEMIAS
jgi:MFS family permease